MRFFISFIVSVFMMGCVTAKVTEKIPDCATLVSDFYGSFKSKGLVLVEPLAQKNFTIHAGIERSNPDLVHAMCLLTTAIPFGRSGCVRIGDITGKCEVDGDLGLWYGYGIINTKEVLKQEEKLEERT